MQHPAHAIAQAVQRGIHGGHVAGAVEQGARATPLGQFERLDRLARAGRVEHEGEHRLVRPAHLGLVGDAPLAARKRRATELDMPDRLGVTDTRVVRPTGEPIRVPESDEAARAQSADVVPGQRVHRGGEADGGGARVAEVERRLRGDDLRFALPAQHPRVREHRLRVGGERGSVRARALSLREFGLPQRHHAAAGAILLRRVQPRRSVERGGGARRVAGERPGAAELRLRPGEVLGRVLAR